MFIPHGGMKSRTLTCSLSVAFPLETVKVLLEWELPLPLSQLPASSETLPVSRVSFVLSKFALPFRAGGLKWTRTTDLTLIRRAL